MIKWFAKKYVLSKVNDLLKKLNSKCDIEKYRTKILSIINFLQSLLVKLDDNQIDDDEAIEIIKEVKQLF